MTLQDEQKPIDIAIADAMVASTPENWNSIILILERQSDSINIGEFTHEIVSPEGHTPVVPEASLYDATYRLDVLLQRHGGIFKKATYRVDLYADEWKYQADFEYMLKDKIEQ
ncbi:MAG: hypothetical protein RW306_13350 [Geobacteraceae bacterium]|nr:hypothetical protein [Geobacteraceae bacterium]